MKTLIVNALRGIARWLSANNHGEKIILLGFIVGLPILVFYNLGINPRPWHDEGAYLGLARTLAEDGVYANRNSDGYQTFGAVQSIGPTVVVPVALVYRLLGVSLFNGRIVVAIYTLVALLLFFLVGRRLFDRWTAIVGIVFLLSAPAVRILIYGREVLGEVPGLAFFLAGWLFLERSLNNKRLWWAGLAGLLFGATIITKSQYILMIPATLGIVAILDLIYYRQKAWVNLVIAVLLAIACAFAWQAWQMNYFGKDVYMQNLANMRQLASVTNGFNPRMALGGIRAILGSDSGHFYLFWGFPALGYVLFLSARRNLKGLLLAILAIFTSLWLVYFIFWSVPWHHYGMPAMTLVSLFVAFLFTEIAGSAIPEFYRMIRARFADPFSQANAKLVFGSLVALLAYGFWAGYNLQQYLRFDVLDRFGNNPTDLRSPPQLQNPSLVAEYLQQNIPPGAVIETWERELGILTDLTYHYPDQSMLVYTHRNLYRGGPEDYLLGEYYLDKPGDNYIIIGWYARTNPIYDMDYIEKNSKLIKSIGEGNYSYTIYQLNQ